MPQFKSTVFLHGFMGSAQDWEGVQAYIPDALKAEYIDLPGHGTEEKNRPRSFNAVIEWLHSRYHASSPINLVGYSMGGRVAMSFASAYPECVHRLVLESSNPGLTDFPARKKRLQSDQIMAARLKKEPFETFVDDWYTAPIFSSLQGKGDLLKAIKARRLEQNPFQMAHMIQTMSPGRQPDCHPFLEQTDLPILSMVGAEDEKYIELAQSINGKAYEVAILENAGHTVHAEQPKVFAQHVVEFLTREDQ